MKTIVAILIVLIGVTEIYAQIIQPETSELQTNKKWLQETKSESDLLIQQVRGGNRTLMAAKQELDMSNRSIINQTGNNHNTNLTQTGNGNEANLLSEGGFTNMNVTQTGNNNSIFSNLSNNTLQLYSAILEQKGNSNNIELTLLGNNVITDIGRVVNVAQTGNDLHFSGTYDSPEMPVQIEQKSGINGLGMSVNVTTSAFYFPMKTD
jgi:hypothetical protein